MAWLKVVTKCQISCSCGRTGPIRESHETAMKDAATTLVFCRRSGHVIVQHLWLNISRRIGEIPSWPADASEDIYAVAIPHRAGRVSTPVTDAGALANPPPWTPGRGSPHASPPPPGV